MKRLISILILICSVGSLTAQQVIINRIEQMPNIPQPYLMRDWKQVAQNYDSLVFDTKLSGQYLPLVGINNSGVNYPAHKSAAMVSYVGQAIGTSAEGINFMPALIGATLSGINKSNQFANNWILMSEDFFNSRNLENVYLNGYSASSGNDWWYETMPNVFFYQLNALYPNTGDFNSQFKMVADRWLEATDSMGGSTTPWKVPYMNYRAWNLKQMKPLTVGTKEPEAAGAIAWLLYNAYVVTKNKDYLIGAEQALEFLSKQTENPSYELQLPYGTYVAARMNAEIGTNYDIEKMLNWSFNRGSLRGWGTIVGKWGNYDCSGLVGEANDAGNDYAFIMNGFQQVAALVPLVRYNEHYANAIGKWVLNVANASRLFYSGFLPNDQQDSETWASNNDPQSTIAHEAMKETLNGKSPFATGDAIRNGWAPTNLALYGSSSVGYFGGIISKTNVEAILKLDLCKTDFYGTSYPSFLVWNPYEHDTTVSINVGDSTVDIYNPIKNAFILKDVSGFTTISVPAKNAVILVYVPINANIKYDRNKTLANNIVIDYDNGTTITDHPPRIKALKALKNPVVLSDSIKIYCSVQNTDNDKITYNWTLDSVPVQGDSVLSLKAPQQIGFYNINCELRSSAGISDSANVLLEVKNRIPSIPKITSLKADPGIINKGESSSIHCQVYDANGDSITYKWSSAEGKLNGNGETIQWTAPDSLGNYTIYCSASDIDGASKDSLIVMVRDMSAYQIGEPVLYLPFDGNVNDYSPYKQETTFLNINYGYDTFGNTAKAAIFDGSSSYVSIKNNARLNFTSGMTLTGWIYSQNQGSTEAYPISHGNWENRWKVSIANNLLRFTIKTNQGTKDLDAKTLINNDEWYHFAMVYTGTDMELYLNGQLDSFVPFSGDIATTTYDLVLGKARPDQGFYFKGKLDEIYLFDHPLSPTQIKGIYDNVTSTIFHRSSQETIKVFPNPAKGNLNIDFSRLPKAKIEYQLIDVFGKIIIKGNFLDNPTSQFHLDTGSVPSGVYILKIETGKMSVIKKIIISK